jgi:hypothetical protein
MKNLIFGTVLLSLSAGTVVHAKDKILTAKDHVDRLTKSMTSENQELIAELISDTSIQSLSAELNSKVNWTDADTKRLKKSLSKRKSALVASIFGNQIGIGSPSSIVWDEVQKIKPETKNLSADSKKTIESKILPAVDKAASKTIFSESEVSGTLGIRNGSSVVNVGAKFCFKPIAISQNTTLERSCLKTQLGSITGISLVDGKLDIKNSSFADKLKEMGLGIHVSALNIQHNFNSNHFTMEFVRPGLEYKPLTGLTLRMETPLGLDSDGLYSGVDLKAGYKHPFKIGSKRGCASLDLGTSFGIDGNIQLFGAAEAMVDLTGDGVNLGLTSQYLMNTEDGNTRGNQTLSGGQFYGPGYFVGLGLKITR